jgi:hypothetical protein
MLFFNLARAFNISCTGRLANEVIFTRPVFRFDGPTKLVPVNRTALVGHCFSFGRVFFFGRPPNLPFSRDVAALRFERAAPRQAGQ